MLRKRGKMKKKLASPFAIAMAMAMLTFVSEIFNILEVILTKIALTMNILPEPQCIYYHGSLYTIKRISFLF